MKNVIINLALFLLPFSAIGQTWTYKKGGDPFDGTYRTSSIQGVGYRIPYTNPLFVFNVYKGDVDNPNIYITRVPYAGCDNNEILIKFDEDEKTYQPNVSSSRDKDNWFMEFTGDYVSIKDSVKKTIKYYIVSENQIVNLRKEPNSNSPVSFVATWGDTIKLLVFDGNYWTCKYKNFRLYAHDTYITNFDKAINSRDEIYIPIEKKIKTDKELKDFIKDLKSHSIMHIRLLSDCVKSDFEFSLNGSTAALNFVLSK